jgi:hypothetical protein
MYEYLSILPVPPRKVGTGAPQPERAIDPAFWKFQGRYGGAARSRCRSRSKRRGLQHGGEMSQCQHAPAPAARSGPARFKVAGWQAACETDRRSHHKETRAHFFNSAQLAGAGPGIAFPPEAEDRRGDLVPSHVRWCRPVRYRGTGSRCHLRLPRPPTSMRAGSGWIRFLGEAGAARYAARDYWRPGAVVYCKWRIHREQLCGLVVQQLSRRAHAARLTLPVLSAQAGRQAARPGRGLVQCTRQGRNPAIPFAVDPAFSKTRKYP